MDKNIVVVSIAIVSLTLIVIIAMFKNINGAVIASATAAIAGLVGYKLHEYYTHPKTK